MSREIDAEVAEKVMGWGHAHRWSDWTLKGRVMAGNSWSPSTDIAAAWEVVEKVRETHEEVSLTCTEKGYSCYIFKSENHVPEGFTSKTMPMAICLAALKALGPGGKEKA